MQTPQGAFFTQLLSAYEQLEKDGRQVTDDLAAMEAVGSPPGWWQVTTPTSK